MDVTVIQLAYNVTFSVGLATELYLAVGLSESDLLPCRISHTGNSSWCVGANK